MNEQNFSDSQGRGNWTFTFSSQANKNAFHLWEAY